MKTSLFTFLAVFSLNVLGAAAQTPDLAAGNGWRNGARIAFIDMERVTMMSATGKAAAAQIESLQGQKTAELLARQKQLQTLQARRKDGVAILAPEALSQLDSEVGRAQRDLERFSEDAQQEVQQFQVQIQRSFAQKLFPIIGQVAKTKDLWAVFRLDPQNLLWYEKALDISDEIIARLDAPPIKPQ